MARWSNGVGIAIALLREDLASLSKLLKAAVGACGCSMDVPLMFRSIDPSTMLSGD
jgi:hypothetical protein